METHLHFHRSQDLDGVGISNPSSWKTIIRLSCRVNIMVVDDLWSIYLTWIKFDLGMDK